MPNFFYITNRKWSDKDNKFSHSERDVKLNCGQFLANSKLIAFQDSSELLDKVKSFKKCLIYLHGMNYTFNFARHQFSSYYGDNCDSDTCFVLFAWACQFPGEYLGDRKIARESSVHFAPFLKAICASHPQQVHVLCHSMGGYVLWKTLRLLDDVQLGKVFFMASDVKKSHFKKRLERLTKRATHVVNYSYKYDFALYMSRWVSFWKKKIGASTVSGIENINVHKDITSIDSKNSHTYVHHKKIIADILHQLLFNDKPEDRGLEKRSDAKAYILK